MLLDLSDNYIHEPLQAFVSWLHANAAALSWNPSLAHLYIAENNITGPLPLDLFTNLTNLIFLDLSNNSLNTSDLLISEGANRRRSVLSQEDTSVFHQLGKLEELRMPSNGFEGMLPAAAFQGMCVRARVRVGFECFEQHARNLRK